MFIITQSRIRAAFLLFAFPALLLLVVSCSRSGDKASEYAYVSVSHVNIRDRVAPIYNKVGTLNNGERVEVLDHQKRFVRVKTSSGAVGWMEMRYLADEDTYKEFQALAAENKKVPVQAIAVTRAALNVHDSPGRDTDHLYQLKQDDRIEVLERSTAERPYIRPARIPARMIKKTGEKEEEDESAEPPPKPLENWLLIRDAEGHTGWVLARMVYMDIPLDVAQYAEGQRIVGYFKLNTVHDDDAPAALADFQVGGDSKDEKRGPREVPQYLVLLTTPKDGQPWDYDQVRIFTWNVKRDRYETAYRERNLYGEYPVITGKQEFGKEGTQPVFTLREQDDQGKVVEKKYRLIGPIVRRVLTPEEEAREKTEKAARSAARRHPRRR